MNEKANNTISSCIIQAFTGIPFLIAAAGMILALVIGGFPAIWSALESYKRGLLEYGVHFDIFQAAIQSDAMCLLLPVFSTLPFTASFQEDMDSGFVKNYLPRAGRGHYIAGKLLAAGISGGSVSAAAIGIYYHALRLLLLPMEKRAAFGITAVTYGQDAARACVLFFCTGMLFSLVGMLFSIVTSSKYMAYAAPFVLEYVLIILCERYLKSQYMIDPREWVTPTREQWFMGDLGVFVYLVMIVLLTILILVIVMIRRLDEI
ncbi:MAG: hypothetical protein PUB22_05610 [Clostridiales bacterium]|nr:hypothetical protein [Clostridiales bacterium]